MVITGWECTTRISTFIGCGSKDKDVRGMCSIESVLELLVSRNSAREADGYGNNVDFLIYSVVDSLELLALVPHASCRRLD